MKVNYFSLLISITAFLPFLLNAAICQSSKSMIKDASGTAYVIWTDTKSNLQAAVTPTDNSAWEQTLIALQSSCQCIAVPSSPGMAVIIWVSTDSRTFNDTLYACLYMDNKWMLPGQAISNPKDQVFGRPNLEVSDNGIINIGWNSSAGIFSASAPFGENPTWTIIAAKSE